jgi:hypothetical protein
MIRTIAEISKPLAIWGGAGKGMVLGHALQESAVSIQTAIDAHESRWGTYLETSGISVISPLQAMSTLDNSTVILVCNPNHYSEIEKFLGGKFSLLLPKDLI